MKAYLVVAALTIAGIVASLVVWPYDGGFGPVLLIVLAGLTVGSML